MITYIYYIVFTLPSVFHATFRFFAFLMLSLNTSIPLSAHVYVLPNFPQTCVLLNILLLLLAGQWSREEASSSGHFQETQNTKEEEAKGPK